MNFDLCQGIAVVAVAAADVAVWWWLLLQLLVHQVAQTGL
jgi:hypothetical protein